MFSPYFFFCRIFWKRAVVCLAALTAVSAGAAARAQSNIRAKSADAFVDSMGVNVHLEYGQTPYKNYDAINHRLVSLGMRHIRDEINRTQDKAFVAELQQMHSLNYNVCGLIEGGNDYPKQGSTLEAKDVVPMIQNLLPSIDAVEGPNEPDDATDPPFTYGLDYLFYPQGAINESEALWSIVKGSFDPRVRALPVLAMSEGTAPDFTELAAITPPPIDYATYGNMHAYQGGLVGDSGLADYYLPYARDLTGAKPLWTTEMGYHDNTNFLTDGEQQGVSQRASAIYLPIAFLSGFNHNVVRTFSYELIDEVEDPPLQQCPTNNPSRCMGEGYYGLLNYDGSPKPAFTALENLIALLREPGVASFELGSLSIAFDGAPSTLRYTLLEKSDGDYYLALWNNVIVYRLATAGEPGADVYPENVPVTISFSNPETLTVYAPNDPSGVSPTAAYTRSTRASSIEINLPPEVLLIKIIAKN
jgi:hypothetical protein